MKIGDVGKLLDEKLGSINKQLEAISERVATKDDLSKMEKKLTKRFDSMDKRLDHDLANTMQRVKHIVNPTLTPGV